MPVTDVKSTVVPSGSYIDEVVLVVVLSTTVIVDVTLVVVSVVVSTSVVVLYVVLVVDVIVPVAVVDVVRPGRRAGRKRAGQVLRAVDVARVGRVDAHVRCAESLKVDVGLALSVNGAVALAA